MRHRSGEGYQKMSAALKVPKNTVSSIIQKWTKFRSTKNLPSAVGPAKLSNRERRALVREVTKNLTELQSSSLEMVVLLEGSPIFTEELWSSVRVTIGFLVTSMTKALLPRLLSAASSGVSIGGSKLLPFKND